MRQSDIKYSIFTIPLNALTLSGGIYTDVRITTFQCIILMLQLSIIWSPLSKYYLLSTHFIVV